jgi:hypothetical protein
MARTRRSTSAESGLVGGEVLLDAHRGVRDLGAACLRAAFADKLHQAIAAYWAAIFAYCVDVGTQSTAASAAFTDDDLDPHANRCASAVRALAKIYKHATAAQQHRHEALAAGAQCRGRAVEPEAQLLGGTRAVGEVRDRRRDAREGGLGAGAAGGGRERTPGRGVDREPGELATDGALGEGGDLGLGQESRGAAQDVAERAAEAADMLGIAEPVDDHAARREGGELGADHLRGEPLVLHRRDDAVDELVATLDDERGVRDRDAERMTKERGHGEPVGDAADHRGLEAGGDDREPRQLGRGAVGERHPTQNRAEDGDQQRDDADVAPRAGGRAGDARGRTRSCAATRSASMSGLDDACAHAVSLCDGCRVSQHGAARPDGRDVSARRPCTCARACRGRSPRSGDAQGAAGTARSGSARRRVTVASSAAMRSSV